MSTSRTAGAAVALCVLSGAADVRAFRTASDTPQFAGADKISWQFPVIPIVLHSDGAPGFRAGQLEPVVREALATWNGTACGQLFLDYQGVSAEHARSGDSLNTLEWVSFDWELRGFAPDQAAMTVVQYERLASGHWVIAEADTYFNAELYGWTLDAVDLPGLKSIRSVLTHELGHTVGLIHVCEAGGAGGAPDCSSAVDFEGSIMHPEYSAARTVLSADDEQGVCFLYPGTRCEVVGCPAGTTCTQGGCVEPCGTASCSAGQHCIDGACEDSAATRGSTAADCGDGTDRVSGPCLQGSCRQTGDTDFGVSCARASDCASGLCLADITDEPVCTRRCGEGYGACAHGWSCEDMGEGKVCTPRSVRPGGGCEVSSGSGSHSAWMGIAVCCLAIGCRLRRHSRQGTKRRIEKW